jgi:hypothetical protein
MVTSKVSFVVESHVTIKNQYSCMRILGQPLAANLTYWEIQNFLFIFYSTCVKEKTVHFPM